MFEKLSPKGKRLFYNGIIVFAIMLFIIGYIIGSLDDKEKTENEQAIEDNKKNETSEGEGLSYSDLHENQQDDSSHSSEKDEPMHEDYTLQDPEVDFNENAEREISILEDYFSQDQIDKAKELSKAFITALYSFDGDNPKQHIEKAFSYVTDSLKQKIKGNVVRPTYNYHSRRYTEIFVYEPYNPSGDYMNIKVRIKGNVYNSNGEKTKEEILDYDLKLIPFEGTFLIDDYSYLTFR